MGRSRVRSCEPVRRVELQIGELVRRFDLVSRFLYELRTQQQSLLGTNDLSDGQFLAIAQHFGMPTPLLDFTRSVRVAAFFATHDFTRLGTTAGGTGLGSIIVLRGRSAMRRSADVGTDRELILTPRSVNSLD